MHELKKGSLYRITNFGEKLENRFKKKLSAIAVKRTSVQIYHFFFLSTNYFSFFVF